MKYILAFLFYDAYNYFIYFGVFFLGFLCAIIFFNYKIKKIIEDKFHDYKRLYRNKYGGFSFIRFDVIKILKERKENYQKEAEYKPAPASKIESGNVTPESRQNQSANSQQQYKRSHFITEPNEEKQSPTVNWEDIKQAEYPNRSNEKKINSLYFSAPEQNGFFLLENSSNAATSRSYYKIEHAEDENIGKLIYRSLLINTNYSNLRRICGIAIRTNNSFSYFSF